MTPQPGVFVTGTDTDVGKTLISAWLTLHLRAAYWKPVQAGSMGGGDPASVASLVPGATIVPPRWKLRQPASPHLAARIDGVTITLADFALPKTRRPLVIEGAGGVLVPLNDSDLMIDLIEAFGFPVIVVARSGLGTINHTLLTLGALRARSIIVAGVVLNGPPNAENRAAIEHFGAVRVIGQIPHLDEVDSQSLQKLPKPEFALTPYESFR